MNSVVRLLFHEVADLTRSERDKLFAERQIDPQLRAEIESLLSFDLTNDQRLTESIANSAVFKSDHNADSVHWGPYRRVRILGADCDAGPRAGRVCAESGGAIASRPRGDGQPRNPVHGCGGPRRVAAIGPRPPSRATCPTWPTRSSRPAPSWRSDRRAS